MNRKIAIRLMLILVAAITLFHFSILFKITPYDITWGGKLKNEGEMYVFETISLIINFILGITLLIKGNYIKRIVPPKVINIILWVFLIIFAVNTIGNIFAETNFEKMFSFLTLAFSVLIWIILKRKD